MDKEKLKKVLEDHRLWLVSGAGKCADLHGADLHGADLHGADLRRVALRGAHLSGVNLGCANLYKADLGYTDLSYADLSYTDLHGVDLSCANLAGADLSVANLYRANLAGANLVGANLAGANLSGANLSGVKYNETTAFFALQCPEEGAFVGWKKCKGNVLVKLLIPEDAKRSSATSRKCRASKAVVLEVIGAEKGFSTNDGRFVYEVGKEVVPDSFDEDRWKECSHGIHFFVTRAEAENY